MDSLSIFETPVQSQPGVREAVPTDYAMRLPREARDCLKGCQAIRLQMAATLTMSSAEQPRLKSQ